MHIVSTTLRPCSQALSDPSWKFARATVPRLDGWTVVLEDADGVRGLGYAHAIPRSPTPATASRPPSTCCCRCWWGRRRPRCASSWPKSTHA